MAQLRPMPPIQVAPTSLARIGEIWERKGGSLPKKKGEADSNAAVELGNLFDSAVAHSMAEMLGGIPVVVPKATQLLPSQLDCVELGPVRVVGGVRPQNFDVGYRPDGVRFVFDSKTLNEAKSAGKNTQNMINDISTEATTVHTRFPHAIVTFMVVYPRPVLTESLLAATTEILERLARRVNVHNFAHMAEAISLVLWDPKTGIVDPTVPARDSHLRVEEFSRQVETAYKARYKGLPPHRAVLEPRKADD